VYIYEPVVRFVFSEKNNWVTVKEQNEDEGKKVSRQN
jgi:hypothetical protein